MKPGLYRITQTGSDKMPTWFAYAINPSVTSLVDLIPDSIVYVCDTIWVESVLESHVRMLYRGNCRWYIIPNAIYDEFLEAV